MPIVFWSAVGGIAYWLWATGEAVNEPLSETSEAAKPLAPKVVGDATAKPNPAFENAYRPGDWQTKMAKDVLLSKAGYPIIVVRKPVPACANPLQLQLAMDMMVANKSEAVKGIAGCLILQPGWEAEWTKLNYLNKGYMELRIPAGTGLPLTAYAPGANGQDQPFFGWFNNYKRP